MDKFNPVTHVIFDCDGLLLNTEDVYEKIDGEILARYGKDYPASLRLKVLGISEPVALRTIISDAELPLTYEEYYAERDELTSQRLPNAQLMPGVYELVQNLFRLKVPMAIATGSTMDSFRMKMSKHEDFLKKYFSHVVAGTDPEVEHGKPAPDVFLVCAKRFSDSPSPSQCLVFEDSPNGVIAAKRAGMQAVMVPAPYITDEEKKLATLAINSLEEFKPEWFHLPSFQ